MTPELPETLPLVPSPRTGLRQRLLVLYLARPELSSATVAWSYYDGTGAYEADMSDPSSPPYPSALEAMRDGWRVLQLPILLPPSPGEEYEVGYLRYPVVLETMEEIHE